MSKKRRVTGILLNIAIAFMAIHGIGCMPEKGWDLIRRYDVICSVMTAAACLLSAGCFFFAIDAPRWVNYLKLTTAAEEALTFIAVTAVLVPASRAYKGMLLDGGMIYLHVVCPVLSIVSLLLLDRIKTRPVPAGLLATIPTLIYGIVMLILNLTGTVFGPHEFLTVTRSKSYAYLWMPALLALTVLLGIILALANQMIHKTPASGAPASEA